MNTVGGHIRKLRRQRKLSQQTLAEKLNVTQETVSQWEEGLVQPDIDTLARIAEALGVKLREVIYGTKAPYPAIPRRWYWIGFIGFGFLALALLAILKLTPPKDMFDALESGWLGFFWHAVPLLYLLIPMSVLSGCSLVWDIRIQHRVIRLIIFLISLSLILFCYVFVLIFPVIFLLPGIGLFLGLNGRWRKS